MKTRLLLIFTLTFSLFIGCKKSNNDITTGIVTGIIKNVANSEPVPNARVLVFDANTNAPAASSIFSDNNGIYSFDLVPGSYYVKISKLGFESVPPPNIIAVPFSVVLQQTATMDYQMTQVTTAGLGTISGQVIASSKPAAGVLVVASGTTAGYSSVSDKNGNYAIYNVPAGAYFLKAWSASFNSSSANISLASSGDIENSNLTLTPGASGNVTGAVTFLSTTNSEVDVSLVNPQTRETVPGLITNTSGGNYSISNVPAGTYIARASYANDGKVVDPDWILKNGEPTVTVGTTPASLNFSVTGAVSLTSPTNTASTTQPLAVSSTTPTFTWLAYASTDNYVIEISDINGNVIWGGFSNSGTVRNFVIPKTTTYIIYNNNGTATQPLQIGKIYRWRIFACKADSGDPRGWKTISVSEDQQGLIKIGL